MGGNPLLFPDDLTAVLPVIAAQGGGGLFKLRGADNLEERLKTQILVSALRHHQVIALRHQGNEIQAQGLGCCQDAQAHTGAAVTRPLAATVGISSGGRRFFRSNRDQKISLASGSDFIRK